jgi:hypothetical protein
MTTHMRSRPPQSALEEFAKLFARRAVDAWIAERGNADSKNTAPTDYPMKTNGWQ